MVILIFIGKPTRTIECYWSGHTCLEFTKNYEEDNKIQDNKNEPAFCKHNVKQMLEKKFGWNFEEAKLEKLRTKRLFYGKGSQWKDIKKIKDRMEIVDMCDSKKKWTNPSLEVDLSFECFIENPTNPTKCLTEGRGNELPPRDLVECIR